MGGTSCRTDSDVITDGIVLTIGGAGGGPGIEDGQVFVFGAAPDQASSSRLRLKSGRESRLDVERNAWSAVVDGPTASAALEATDGTVLRTVPVVSYEGAR